MAFRNASIGEVQRWIRSPADWKWRRVDWELAIRLFGVELACQKPTAFTRRFSRLLREIRADCIQVDHEQTGCKSYKVCSGAVNQMRWFASKTESKRVTFNWSSRLRNLKRRYFSVEICSFYMSTRSKQNRQNIQWLVMNLIGFPRPPETWSAA